MAQFLAKRLMFMLFSAIGATVVIFTLSRMAQDPRELFVPDSGYGISEEAWQELGNKLGFDKPVVVQYFLWIGRMLKGDFGESLSMQLPVSSIIRQRMGATLQLALGGWLFAVLVGVPIGILASTKRGQFWDYVGRGFALLGQALPQFLVGIILISIFAVGLDVLPVGTRSPTFNIKDYILPSVTLGWLPAAGIMRLTRSAMLEILDSEYIKLARAKGVSSTKVIWKHAFRNALIPPLTSALLLMAGFLNGAVVVESIFAWPGVGWVALFRAVYDNDFPLLLGSVFFFLVIYLLFALIADVLYALIDPRIRYS